MASLLLGGPLRDENGNPKKLPRVAVYVGGATFAITTGLTLLILPYVRQAARMTAAPQFLSNRYIARKDLHALPAQSELPITTARAKSFNDREERQLYGSLEGEHEQVSPWLGAQALGIATAVVFGSAGLGAWVVAKLLGVKDMSEFSGMMREELQMRMPALATALQPRENPVEREELAGVEDWVRRFEQHKGDPDREL